MLAHAASFRSALKSHGACSGKISKGNQGASDGFKPPSANLQGQPDLPHIWHRCGRPPPIGPQILLPDMNFLRMNMQTIATSSGVFTAEFLPTAASHAYPGANSGLIHGKTWAQKTKSPWNSWKLLTNTSHPSASNYETKQAVPFSEIPISKPLWSIQYFFSRVWPIMLSRSCQ